MSTKEELLAEAEKLGVETDATLTKAEIQKQIDEAKASKPQDGDDKGVTGGDTQPAPAPTGDASENLDGQGDGEPLANGEKGDGQQVTAGRLIDKPRDNNEAVGIDRAQVVTGQEVEGDRVNSITDSTVMNRIADSFAKTNPAPRPKTNADLNNIGITKGEATLVERPANGDPVFSHTGSQAVASRVADLVGTYGAKENTKPVSKSGPEPTLQELNAMTRKQEAEAYDHSAEVAAKVAAATEQALGLTGAPKRTAKPVVAPKK